MAIYFLFGNLGADPDAYRDIAENVRNRGQYARTIRFENRNESQTLRTAFRPPLYPLFLSLLVTNEKLSSTSVALFHLALALGTAYLIWLIARELRLKPAFAIFAGLFFAIDPILINQSALVMTETLATFLAMASVFFAIKFQSDGRWIWAILFGLTTGLGCLCRPIFLVFFLIWLFSLFFQLASKKFQWKAIFAGGICFLLVMAPWVIRNKVEFGQFKITTFHGGYTLLLGNNEHYFAHLNDGIFQPAWKPSIAFKRTINQSMNDAIANADPDELCKWEIEFDEKCYQQAFSDIANDKATFAKASFVRIGQLWSPLPAQTERDESINKRIFRYGIGIAYCCFFLLVFRGILIEKKNGRLRYWIWPSVLCLVFTLVHAFFWSNMRMRAPLMPILDLLAASGMFALVQSMRSRQSDSLDDSEGPKLR